ncbi:hypothetical protein nbrc107696_03720 [Gordonia spumicola]|uniref:4,4'-diaponeurosporenoate glycosyltransferase n=1 Tax=Gordonia spumicola TaxID=589161 RepID=A0A7I9V3D7_9ACTN|nr:hypothetical protein nbrc107696_03720 [Gordonia spumicola]
MTSQGSDVTLSLVIPVYNEEDILAACLEHVAGQDRPVDECIVVDNNCTDGSRAIAESFSDRLPIRIVEESRPGVYWAREAGFSAASGDILGRIDADTRLEPEWTSVVTEFLESQTDVAAMTGVGFGYDAPFAERIRTSLKAAAEKARRSTVAGRRANTVFGANMAVRRPVWNEVRERQVEAAGTHEDHDLFYALDSAGHVAWQHPSMIAGVSARRMAAPIRSNAGYAAAAIRTAWLHGRRREAVVQAVKAPGFFVSLLVMKVVLVPFDPSDRSWRPGRNMWADRKSPVNE